MCWRSSWYCRRWCGYVCRWCWYVCGWCWDVCLWCWRWRCRRSYNCSARNTDLGCIFQVEDVPVVWFSSNVLGSGLGRDFATIQIEGELEVGEQIHVRWCIRPQSLQSLLICQCSSQVLDGLLNCIVILFDLLLCHLCCDGLIDCTLKIIRCNHVDHLLTDSLFDSFLRGFTGSHC